MGDLKQSKVREIKVAGFVNFFNTILELVPIPNALFEMILVAFIDLLLAHEHADQELRTLYLLSD